MSPPPIICVWGCALIPNSPQMGKSRLPERERQSCGSLSKVSRAWLLQETLELFPIRRSSAHRTSRGKGKLLQVTPWEIASLQAIVRSHHSCNNGKISSGTRGSDWDRKVTNSEATWWTDATLRPAQLQEGPHPGRKVLLCKEFLAAAQRKMLREPWA